MYSQSFKLHTGDMGYKLQTETTVNVTYQIVDEPQPYPWMGTETVSFHKFEVENIDVLLSENPMVLRHFQRVIANYILNPDIGSAIKRVG